MGSQLALSGNPRPGTLKAMSIIEQYYMNCKTFREQIARIERHIKDDGIYTAFDFSRVQSVLIEYETWAQANSAVIDAALKPADFVKERHCCLPSRITGGRGLKQFAGLVPI